MRRKTLLPMKKEKLFVLSRICRSGIGRLISPVLLRFGYVLKRVNQPGLWAPVYLRRLGFNPRTVVDVGVGSGTHSLYETFPKCNHILIEPLEEFEADLQKILLKYKGRYFLTALGAREGKHIMNIESIMLQRSSFLERTSLEKTGDPLLKREVPLTTLDTLNERYHFEPPFGLKIDSEGYECQIVKGASKFLQKTLFVIAEISVANRFLNGYSFAEYIELMHRNQFRLCDILDIGRDGPLLEVTFVDVVFRRTSRIK